MSTAITRRKFFRKAGHTLIAGGAVAYGGAVGEARAKEHPVEKGVDYYSKLGVTPFINAGGTFTILSASILPAEVQAAMTRAAQQPVNIEELHRAAGEYLARRLHCEAALVTAGAASALTLGTAACITLGNEQAIVNVPVDMTGLKNEVIVQKTHRYGYDHALRNCGIKFVEVETMQEYEAAFNERTVMTNFFNAAEAGQISREDWVRVAHKHGVPCFNDAAADVPPIANLWNYVQMGFDLVTFSGGKGIRGPQCTGLLLGRKDLIECAKKQLSLLEHNWSRHEGGKGRDHRLGRRSGLAVEPGRGGHAGGVPETCRKNRQPGEGYSHRGDQDLSSSRCQPRPAFADYLRPESHPHHRAAGNGKAPPRKTAHRVESRDRGGACHGGIALRSQYNRCGRVDAAII